VKRPVTVTVAERTLGTHTFLESTPFRADDNGRTVIFIHGAFVGAWCWEYFLPHFAGEGFRAIAPDLLGHGRRRPCKKLGRASVFDYIEDARSFLRAVCSGEDMPVIVGHSMGGLIAQKLAEEGLASAVLLLASAPPSGITLGRREMPWFTPDAFHAITSYVFGQPFRPSRRLVAASLVSDDPVFVERTYLRFGEESMVAVKELMNSEIAVNESLIEVPVLVLAAEADRVISTDVASGIREKYEADMHVLPALGHSFIFEAGWEKAASLSSLWVKQRSLFQDW